MHRRSRNKLFKKQYAIHKRKKLRLVHRVRKHPAFFVPTFTFGVLLIVVVAGLVISAKGNPAPQLLERHSRIVILTADKKEQIIPTSATTVGDLLKRLNITLNEGDVVEPARDTEIVSDNFKVNVYRALPITIVDHGKEIHALSAAATPRSIAKQAGIETFPEDNLVVDPASDFITQGTIGQKMVVDRATPINVNLYGTQLSMRTQAETVGQFLKEKKIKLGKGETVQPSVDSPLTATAPVFVNRKDVKVETVTEDIGFGTETVEDPNLSFGVKAVRQQGTPGKKAVTYQVNTQTGARTPFNEFVIQAPIPQIVARGSYINIPNDKQSVMAAAGINRSDYMYVDFIISHESRWNAAALNSRGCGGLGQACPASKLAAACPTWQRDPVCQLRWFSGYSSRYGGWGGAYNAWQSKGWW
jgi:uncharacterized protein YabE (DUF348 family)